MSPRLGPLEVVVELRRYEEAASFAFGNLSIRDMTPTLFKSASLSEVDVPIGADNPPYAAAGADKLYMVIAGEIEFNVDDALVRVSRGDVLVIKAGEQYRYHNGGYEPGRLLLIQVPPG